jgi:hypothetical protein
MDVGQQGDQHDGPEPRHSLLGLTPLKENVRNVLRCPPTGYMRSATEERIWSERDKPVEPAFALVADSCLEKCWPSAEEYDDQIGDADGDDAADCCQQQDALKSGHSFLLRGSRGLSWLLMRAEIICCFPETAWAGATFALALFWTMQDITA